VLTPRITSPAPRDVWRSVLAADPNGVASQTPEWTDWLCRTRGYQDASRLYEFPDGRQLVLPLVARSLLGIRVSEESMPYGFGYGGVLVSGGDPRPEEAAAVLADLGRRPVAVISLFPLPTTSDLWAGVAPRGALRVPYRGQVLDLQGGYEGVFAKRFAKDTRKKIRRAQRADLKVRETPDAGVPAAFMEVNERSVQRWARDRGQPLWLARLVERRRNRVGQLATATATLGSMCVGFSAHRDGAPVAAYISLLSGEQAFGWMSAIDRGPADETYAGYLLQSLAIEDACAKGCTTFLMGESDPGSGVDSFKRGFGATTYEYEALRFERVPLTATDKALRRALAWVLSRRPGTGDH
jgi:CelD/BcsL family acetyltransferase involved in cellulose biosynthesis